MNGIEITATFFADVTRRWAAACGYNPQSARVHLHNRVGSVACGPLDSGVSVHVLGDDISHTIEELTIRMLQAIGEAGDFGPALVASLDSIERSRAQREMESRVAPRDER